ncbi:ribosome assembly factor SBDS [Methanocella sp. CWC-04]|uniref:Ribosome assembly factor SBDS n=1 Tax=Methanooceanicella nereidis TaxID=2052831 RepID=A0AAP2RH62_9EURY|nr:ribosome assembly factor SBDS [Methanocella sp. CWC-04]MCD1296147.1 ribosome assembly factor SBDS [Methanocella sp. CWC-04]
MVALDKAVVARLKTHGEHFEILVDPEGAYDMKKGASVRLEDILAVEEVFENASRGDRVPEEDLIKAFGTTNVFDIARKIVLEGEINLTSEQRHRLIEDKRRQVVTFISRNAINPQTMTPHPPMRIERAMEEAGVHIDLTKSVEENVNLVMKAIRPIIPIRFEEVKVAVKVPANYAARAYGELQSFGKLVRDEWQNDGSWIGVIQMPAGMQPEFYDLVNKLSKGEAETKLLR